MNVSSRGIFPMFQSKRRLLSTLASPRSLSIWLGVATLMGTGYLSVAHFSYGYIGFPLDDAWIHQTYARNLGVHGEFAFTRGQTSTGSTAPLWTLLISLGYLLRIPFKIWTYALGILLLGLSGFHLAQLGRRLWPHRAWLGSLVGLALLAEWHLGWAAVSGMETILFIWLSILLLNQHCTVKRNDQPVQLFALGLLGGLLTLVRPEGLGLVGLVGLEIGLTTLWKPLQKSGQTKPSARALFKRWLILSGGLGLVIVPYLAFNYGITGFIMPNTFYAKQQEYGLWIKEQFTTSQAIRLRLQVYAAPFVGMQILLIPGLFKAAQMIWRDRHSTLGITLVWWVSLTTLYALRLPVTYQHGRYQMTIIPWLLLIGIWGTVHLLKPHHRHLWPRVLSRVTLPSLIIVALIFIGLGMRAYARDVRIIETEMVAISQWLRNHTSERTIIAAHDIGAIGYFTERPLIDLAGLITPDVIPFIRNEMALLDFSLNQGAEYLVTFPSWYPQMTADLTEIYRTDAPWAIEAGGDNMTIYQLSKER